jgi:hypothetical protein
MQPEDVSEPAAVAECAASPSVIAAQLDATVPKPPRMVTNVGGSRTVSAVAQPQPEVGLQARGAVLQRTQQVAGSIDRYSARQLHPGGASLPVNLSSNKPPNLMMRM